MTGSDTSARRPRLIGRRSSHFTRVTRIFAHELDVALELVPIYDLVAVDAASYADNPARKLPTLERAGSGSKLFGTENICRALAESSPSPRRIVWPEQLPSDVSRNAQELVWHAMAAQVQLAFGTLVNELPAANLYFVKGRAGFVGALEWLDTHLDEALAALPASRDLSLFEVTLFCLLEHLPFRGTLSLEPYPTLRRFAQAFGQRASAQATPYEFDVPPAS
jgi:glutathione S-transferase